jgi:pimeloyl-ACP methyl ester carboxylesterase
VPSPEIASIDERPNCAKRRLFAKADLRDVLPRVAVPTLLLYGDQDVRAAARVADDIHAGIPGSKQVVIPGAGHACDIDAPERFNAEVRAFLM